jgi:hypothetical protein
MNFSNFSTSAVWTNPTRTLTGLGTTTITSVLTGHTAIANGTSVDLRPAAGVLRDIVVIGEATVNVTYNSALYDGTTFRIGAGGASGAAFTTVLKGSSAFGPAFNNSGTASGFYNIAGMDWHQ